MAIYEEKIECRTCKKVKPHTQFGKQKRWNKTQNGVTEHLNSRQCKSCDSNDAKIRRNLEKQYPYPQKEICGCCGTDFTNHPKRKKRYLVLDHCHETGIFRNYLCTLCNTSAGGLGDNYERIINRIDFLKPENILKAQNKYRRKDYQTNTKIKVNKLSNSKVNKMEYLELLKVFVDAGELPYAMKVLNQTKEEVSKPINTTTIDTSGLPESEKPRARAAARNKHLQPYDGSKNLQPASLVHGVSRGASLLNRGDEYWNDMIQTGSLYMNEKGNKTEFLVNVDTVPEKWIKKNATIAA